MPNKFTILFSGYNMFKAFDQISLKMTIIKLQQTHSQLHKTTKTENTSCQ